MVSPKRKWRHGFRAWEHVWFPPKPPRAAFDQFLRANNRPRRPHRRLFEAAGYPYCDVSGYVGRYAEMREWCAQRMRPHTYVSFNERWFFVDPRDCTVFTLRWAS